MHNGTHKATSSVHDFSVKLSPCVATLAALAGEMAGIGHGGLGYTA